MPCSVYYGVLLSPEESSTVISYFEQNIHEVASWCPEHDLLRYVNFDEQGNFLDIGDGWISFIEYLRIIAPDAVFTAEKEDPDAHGWDSPILGYSNYFAVHIGLSSDLVLEGFKKKLEVSEKIKNDWKSLYKILKKFGIKNKRPKVYTHSYTYA